MKNTIEIILINFNSSKDTINCIESIKSCDSINDFFHINIFDNASSLEDVSNLKQYVASNNGVTVEFSSLNTGFAHGNNFFMEKIPVGSYIWILNNDTLVNNNLLTKITENLPDEHEVCYFDCHTFDGMYHDSGIHYVSMISGRSKMKKTMPTDFAYICGASFVIKKTENMPLFDESYFLYYEDADYGKLLEKSKYLYKKIDDCFFMHKIGGSSKENVLKKKVNNWSLRSQVLFMKRYSSFFYLYRIIKALLFILRRDRAGLALFRNYCRTIKPTDNFSVTL